MDSIATTDSASLSAIETLPAELIAEILDYTPQSVFILRSVSRIFKSRVDEYALQKPNVVQRIKIADRATGFNHICAPNNLRLVNIEVPETEDNDPTELGIRINISTHMEQVFKLRLSLQSCPFDPKKLGKVKREFVPGQMEISFKLSSPVSLDCAQFRDALIFYLFICSTVRREEREPGWRYLGECLGGHIGSVEYFIGSEIRELPLLDSLLDGKIIGKLSMRITSLISSPLANHIVETTKMYRVDELGLNVHKMDPSADAVKILLELSSLVHTLHLYQHHVPEIDESKHYFFGTYDEDWARIILEMFSNKLRKLHINNHFHVAYLPKAQADSLIENLPLLNKRIWCSISCKKYHGKGLDFVKNDHYIRGS